MSESVYGDVKVWVRDPEKPSSEYGTKYKLRFARPLKEWFTDAGHPDRLTTQFTVQELVDKHGADPEMLSILIGTAFLSFEVPRIEMLRAYPLSDTIASEISDGIKDANRLRWNFECVWKHPDYDWKIEHSDVIKAVLFGNQQGYLSGTTRLVLGPSSVVTELHFEPGSERPEIVVVYWPKDPKTGEWARGLSLEGLDDDLKYIAPEEE